MTTPTSTSLNTLANLTSCAQMVKTFDYSKIYHYILKLKKKTQLYVFNELEELFWTHLYRENSKQNTFGIHRPTSIKIREENNPDIE